MGSEGSGLPSQAAVALPIACGTPGGRVPKGARRFGQDKGGVGRKWKGNSTVWLDTGMGKFHGSWQDASIREDSRRSSQSAGTDGSRGLPARGSPPGNAGDAWEGHGARRRV